MKSRISQILLFLSLLLSGCTADVYVPTTHNTPALEKEGDIEGALYTSTKGTDLQGAYAFSDHLGVGTALNILHKDEENSSDFQRHKYGELSLIYFLNFQDNVFEGFNAFGERNYEPSDQRLKLAFLGIVGVGEGEALQNSGQNGTKEDGDYALGRYSKYALQSNLTFEYRLFSVGVSPKISYINFYDFNAVYNELQPPNSDKTAGFFWEPGFFMGLSFDHIRLELQYGGTRFLSGEPAFDYDRSFISIGLHVRFNTQH